ncbi:MFS transporter [Dickeya lacustris]|uniref:MFS transporter n=1 Tax=Dickeya lacustris TaxID=2259638 RepID=A0ABY8GA14_9GAMM|nr:MFS transporter [Dickeya lacustris]WFN56810.1 MFS transporter [Dickeya lacustris]
MNNFKVSYFIYLAVFFAEFSFFFSLPLLGISPEISAASVGVCLAGAIILESVLMFAIAGYLEHLPRKLLIFSSLLLRAIAFLSLYISLSLISWLLFFLFLSISKAISKPFFREVLTESLPREHVKKAMNVFSLFQNTAVFVAPSLASFSDKYNFMNEIILTVILCSVIMAIFALNITYPPLASNKKPVSRSPLVGLFYAFRGNMAKAVQSILLASFFCFVIMGVFITSTTLIGKVIPDLKEYSGVFFSIVGITICLWQAIFSKFKPLNDYWISNIIIICGALSSIYLLGSLYTAVIALIAYSIYESIVIPEIYVTASGINSDIPSGVMFSYIVILSNAGSAFGSWITGLAIENISEYASEFIFFVVFCSSVTSLFFIKIASKKEAQCQS